MGGSSSLYSSSSSGTIGTVGGTIASSVALPDIVISAQARNSSCGPQPTAPVPLGQLPQLLPEKVSVEGCNCFFKKIITGNVFPLQNAMFASLFGQFVLHLIDFITFRREIAVL